MIEIIPALDVLGGRCVRLTQGDYETEKVYDEDPVAVAKRFVGAGLRRLHLVDLDGARSGQIINREVLERITAETPLEVDFGGGIKTDNDIEIAFECGAKQVTVGSIAIENRGLFLDWVRRYGAEKIILGADARNGGIAIRGWKEQTTIALDTFIASYMEEGVTTVICTAIECDGLLSGPSLLMYQSLVEKFPDLNVIASGGVSCLEDIRALEDIGVYGVIVGKAFYEGRITLEELREESSN